MENDFGLKELEKIRFKATYNIDIGGLHFNEGEVITEIESAQISNFQEIKSIVNASGGFDNRTRVTWDTTKEVRIQFTRGIFNKLQFAMLQNAKLIDNSNQSIIISEVEKLESNQQGIFQIKYNAYAHLVVRDLQGNKITYTSLGNKQYQISTPYKDIIVSYDFQYQNGYQDYIIGQRFLNGFMAFEARTRVKDDITGQTHTGILSIPKIKLASDLSIRLGENASPMIGNFSMIGYPVGSHGSEKVMELMLLSDDIDSDI